MGDTIGWFTFNLRKLCIYYTPVCASTRHKKHTQVCFCGCEWVKKQQLYFTIKSDICICFRIVLYNIYSSSYFSWTRSRPFIFVRHKETIFKINNSLTRTLHSVRMNLTKYPVISLPKQKKASCLIFFGFCDMTRAFPMRITSLYGCVQKL